MSDKEKEKTEPKKQEVKAIEKSVSSSSDVPKEEEIFEAIASKDPETFRKFTTEITSLMMASGPASNPIYSKMNEGHIDKFLDIIDGDGKRKHQYKKDGRKYNVFYSILGVALFVFMLVYFSSDSELLKSILSHLGAFIAGGFGGFGFLKSKKKS